MTASRALRRRRNRKCLRFTSVPKPERFREKEHGLKMNTSSLRIYYETGCIDEVHMPDPSFESGVALQRESTSIYLIPTVAYSSIGAIRCPGATMTSIASCVTGCLS